MSEKGHFRHRRTAPQNAANAAASLRFRHNPKMPINSGLQGELVRYACAFANKPAVALDSSVNDLQARYL
jgi:hypothetical protein